MPKTSSNLSKSIITENPIESLWEQLSLMESIEYSGNILKTKAVDSGASLSPELLKTKAIALSYCIRNAREYLKTPSTSLTTTAIANYYGLLWLCSAISITAPKSEIDLCFVEKATKNGHGLGNIVSSQGKFPNNEFIYVKPSGFFKTCFDWMAIKTDQQSDICFPSKTPSDYESLNEEQKILFVPLVELFARIPELIDTFEEVTGLNAKCFGLFHAANELAIDFSDKTLPHNLVGIYGQYDLDHLTLCDFPLVDLKEHHAFNRDSNSISKMWAGRMPDLPENASLFDTIYNSPEQNQFYISPLSGYFYITPILKHMRDPIAMHLMLSYQLSILARYRPAVWREILEGSLDHYRVLIASYNRIFSRVIPHIALTKIQGRRIRVRAPGTFA